jgi:hypothetical protein
VNSRRALSSNKVRNIILGGFGIMRSVRKSWNSDGNINTLLILDPKMCMQVGEPDAELSKLVYVTDELVQDARFGLVRQVRA